MSAERVRRAAAQLRASRYVRVRQYLVDADRRIDVTEGKFDLDTGILEMAVRLPDQRGEFWSDADTTTFLVFPPHHYFRDAEGAWHRTARPELVGASPAHPAALLYFLESPAVVATEDNAGELAVAINIEQALAHAPADERAAMHALGDRLGVSGGELRANVMLADDGSLADVEIESAKGRTGIRFFDVGKPLEFPAPPADAIDLDI